VLEGLLEDQLSTNRALHFALQPHPKAGMPAWLPPATGLAAAANAGAGGSRAPATRIVPEFAPEGDRCCMRWRSSAANAGRGGSVGVTTLPLSSQALGLLRLPEGRPVGRAPVAALAEQVLQCSRCCGPPGRALAASEQSQWDLAQFELSSSGRSRAISSWARPGPTAGRTQWKAGTLGALLLVA